MDTIYQKLASGQGLPKSAAKYLEMDVGCAEKAFTPEIFNCIVLNLSSTTFATY
jgi:hypothetical protein